jgi:hypothetical protein
MSQYFFFGLSVGGASMVLSKIVGEVKGMKVSRKKKAIEKQNRRYEVSKKEEEEGKVEGNSQVGKSTGSFRALSSAIICFRFFHCRFLFADVGLM